jgi:hypothetical protein
MAANHSRAQADEQEAPAMWTRMTSTRRVAIRARTRRVK